MEIEDDKQSGDGGGEDETNSEMVEEEANGECGREREEKTNRGSDIELPFLCHSLHNYSEKMTRVGELREKEKTNEEGADRMRKRTEGSSDK